MAEKIAHSVLEIERKKYRGRNRLYAVKATSVILNLKSASRNFAGVAENIATHALDTLVNDSMQLGPPR